ncbi:uncharacterized protein BCR38DRAFT_168566 [Pseudomassariella vexata]|uniref:Uncharacterized protein n=1 Tax=Pseudomassariella vexata TaxID=1141098 RepID=A0A1Y2E2X0_9PEZI|nr:uncharacterized protein BCR38DRAFT_168566 [Pseudomassariella vexata]ORY65900.1 hypothetical protein BCR38DRAFT_168566 [Pseudomassariella vexata]
MRVGRLKPTASAGRPPTGESSIRGRISGPIPIPDPVDDDEFPMRQPGTGLAMPLGSESSRPQVPPDSSSSINVQNNSSPPPSAVPEERPVSAVTQPQQEQRAEGPSQASQTSASLPRCNDLTSALRYSTVSAGTETDRSRTGPQRKKSTLRGALTKLFGRKKKRTSNGGYGSALRVEAPISSTAAQHRSDPSALSRNMTKDAEPKRSASLPITEYDRALRSNSIGPDDLMAIESARNSLQGEHPIHSARRRAATATATASRINSTRSRDLGDIVCGLSPRPASSHARGSEVPGDEDPEDIGRAITSDQRALRRRSRSLSQLQNLALDVPEARNRSDEIRYWRESYDPAFVSPTSSNVPDDTAFVNADAPEFVADSPAGLSPKTPPQPFNFGTMMGMKITQAASLEERIVTLETRNEKLERLLAQLFQVIPGVSAYSGTPEREARPEPEGLSATYAAGSAAPNLTSYQTITNDMRSTSRHGSSSRHSNESFGDGHTFIDSVAPSTARANRPKSNTTVRAATSLPTLSREASGPFSADHYTALLALIETERVARQSLEAQVTKLSHRLSLMSRALQKYEGHTSHVSGTYSYESEAFKTPREEQPQHGFGAFGEELVDDDSDGKRKKAARTLSLSQLTLGKPKSKTKTEVGVNL